MYRRTDPSYINPSPEFSARQDVEKLASLIKDRQSIKSKRMLDMMSKHCHESDLLDFRFHTDETILHIAAKYQNDGELTSKLLQLCPGLILKARSCPQYSGQTSLHIAITKGNKKAFKEMLNVASRNPRTLRALLRTKATGRAFVNTVMMGEFPLFVAALKFDKEMVDELLEKGARIYDQNSRKDTIFHTLIKYASVFPEKLAQTKEMMEYLHERLKKYSDDKHEEREQLYEEKKKQRQVRRESIVPQTNKALPSGPFLPPLQEHSLSRSETPRSVRSAKNVPKYYRPNSGTSKSSRRPPSRAIGAKHPQTYIDNYRTSCGSSRRFQRGQQRSWSSYSSSNTFSSKSSKAYYTSESGSYSSSGVSGGSYSSSGVSGGNSDSTTSTFDTVDEETETTDLSYDKQNKDIVASGNIPIRIAWEGEEDFQEISDISKIDKVSKRMYTHVWFLKNADSLTPLQLAAKNGISNLFEFILNIEDIYCVLSADDGLFDVKLYDVTEIDSISSHKADMECSLEADDISPCCNGFPRQQSILETIFENEYKSSSAVELIELLPVKILMQKKWDSYWRYYASWMVVHFLFIVYISAYAVERAEMSFPSRSPPPESTAIRNFVYVSQWITLGFGLANLLLGILLLIPKFKRPNPTKFWRHNIGYIGMIIIMALCFIIDSVMSLTLSHHDGIPMIFALLVGWWFNVFFLRGWQVFSFFTVMIQQVIFGDMFRFSVFIFLELFAFTTCMHMIYQGQLIPSIEDAYAVNNPGNDNFFTTLMAMFNLMLGLDNIYTLNRSRVPWMAYFLFIGFVLLTYVLLLNALIAMMSSTCGMVLRNKYEQWRIQQLSVILFMEDIMYLCCFDKILKCPGKRRNLKIFNPVTMTTSNFPRYYLTMQSLQGEFSTEEESETIQKRAQADINNTVNAEILNTIKEGKFFVPKEEKKPLLVSKQTETEGPNDIDYVEPRFNPVFPVYQETQCDDLHHSDEDEEKKKKALQEAEDAVVMMKKAGRGRIVFYEGVDHKDE